MESVLLRNPLRIARLNSLLNYVAVRGSVNLSRLDEDTVEIAEILIRHKKVRVIRNDWNETIIYDKGEKPYPTDSEPWFILPLVLDMAKENPDNEWHIAVHNKNS